jgi:hypothetical protein
MIERTAPDRGLSRMRDTLRDWAESRALLAEVERAEHPDVTDKYGRIWAWSPGHGDIYVHDQMAWPLSSILSPTSGLPSAELRSNSNYSLCDICTQLW